MFSRKLGNLWKKRILINFRRALLRNVFPEKNVRFPPKMFLCFLLPKTQKHNKNCSFCLFIFRLFLPASKDELLEPSGLLYGRRWPITPTTLHRASRERP